MARVALAWVEREAPRQPEGLVASRDAASRLIGRLQMTPLEGLRACLLVDGGLVLLGAAERLPWVPGAVWWIARMSEAQDLYVPTTLDPNVPPALLRSALLPSAGSGPLVLLPPGDGRPALRVIRLGQPAPLTAAHLAAWEPPA